MRYLLGLLTGRNYRWNTAYKPVQSTLVANLNGGAEEYTQDAEDVIHASHMLIVGLFCPVRGALARHAPTTSEDYAGLHGLFGAAFANILYGGSASAGFVEKVCAMERVIPGITAYSSNLKSHVEMASKSDLNDHSRSRGGDYRDAAYAHLWSILDSRLQCPNFHRAYSKSFHDASTDILSWRTERLHAKIAA